MIKSICSFCVFLFALSISFSTVYAQDLPEIESLQGFDAEINQLMQEWHVPGMAIAIVKKDKVIYMNCSGYRDLEKKLPVTPDTLFAIGSDSKAFTTTALGILVDEDKIDFNKPLKYYMPEFKLADEYASNHATTRDLMLHITGISRNDVILANTSCNRKELINKLQYLQPFAELRQQWRYNNFMYVTLGYLIEKISGKTWENYVQEKILDPLEMDSTNFSVLDSQKTDNYSLPYNSDEEGAKPVPFENADSFCPAGGINSTINDMSKWLILNLNKGKYKDKELISSEMMDEIHTPGFIMPKALPWDELYYESYAYAWGATKYNDVPILRHDGQIRGFHASIFLLPEQNLGIVALSNGRTILPHVTSMFAIDRLLGNDRINWSKRFKDRNKKEAETSKKAEEDFLKTQIKNTKPSLPLTRYTGTYYNDAYGPFDLKMKNNKLVATYNNISYPVSHFHYDIFTMEDEESKIPVQFDMNLKGEISTLKVPFDPDISEVTFKRRK
jgi:CubicO group peptidase (beta-lactamase class C family)